MHNPSPHEPGPMARLRTSANFLELIARTLAYSVEVFLRSGAGSRYANVQAFAVLPVVIIYMMLWPHDNPAPLGAFLALYVLLSVVRTIGRGLRRFRQGERTHSRYSGRPHACRIFSRLSEQKVKQFIEPAIVAALGLIILPWSASLGSYLLVSCFALMICVSLDESAMRIRAMNLHDAMMEQGLVQLRVREFRGGVT